MFSSLVPNLSAYPFQQLWKSKTPLKVISFAWRLFLDRIPTWDALSRRGVPMINGGGASCIHCND
ncbi:putative reverse transcriptase zinc-binding domain-containing protein [Lupinus albus]|uniref:Putative reverse transcriptase zinc-binding domain-containing protein n=1 Tax=Lupinus albus TaxID=3870 RepID=A0A6A4QQU6_LUPAL|nr:putative reverse transcriptase zinc-binding domain-containing protein [Lupinus albus]